MLLAEMTKHEGGRYHDGERFLPWYTSPCLEWLLTLDLKDKKIFEFGVGDSTAWYRSKDAYVRGVENNPEWAKKAGAIEAHCTGNYVSAVGECGGDYTGKLPSWDIIIVDGIWRDDCAVHGWKFLKPGGYMILDNWMQPSVEIEWSQTVELIKGKDRVLYEEPGHYDWCTLVVRK
jgi:predicted O-methyltransferase YrrM